MYEPILIYWTNFWQTFHINSLIASGDTSAIENCIFDLMDIFLAKEHSILKFLFILTDAFWCHIRHKVIHISANDHIFGKLVLDLEHSVNTHWQLLVIRQPWITEHLTLWTYFWPKSIRSGTLHTLLLTLSYVTLLREKSILDLLNIFLAKLSTILNFLYILIDMSNQPYRSPYLTYWTYFWPKSRRFWTFFLDSLTPSDFISAIQVHITLIIFFCTESPRSWTF